MSTDAAVRVLYVVTELPFPPRNGITIPSYHYLRYFREHCAADVDLLFLHHAHDQPSASQVEANRRLVRNLVELPVRPRSTLAALRGELTLARPGFTAYRWDERCLALLAGHAYDLVVYTPISALMVAPWLRAHTPVKARELAIVNDCTTQMLRVQWRASMRGATLRRSVLSGLRWLESFPMAVMEPRLLANCDHIVCQTSTDRAMFSRISKDQLTPKVHVLRNGVDARLAALPLGKQPRRLLVLGNMTSQYRDSLCWILREVWPALRGHQPALQLYVVGQGVDAALRAKLDAAGVVHQKFVPELSDVYKQSMLMLAPIFKGYGLINKVVEAMCAGVPVIGDRTAFHGIDGFVKGVHGEVAEQPREMIAAVLRLLRDESARLGMARQARELVASQFSWQSRFAELDTVLWGQKPARSAKDLRSTLDAG